MLLQTSCTTLSQLTTNIFVLSKKMLNVPDFTHTVVSSRASRRGPTGNQQTNNNSQKMATAHSNRSTATQFLFRLKCILWTTTQHASSKLPNISLNVVGSAKQRSISKDDTHVEIRHTDTHEHNTNAKAVPPTKRMYQCGIISFLQNSVSFFFCLAKSPGSVEALIAGATKWQKNNPSTLNAVFNGLQHFLKHLKRLLPMFRTPA